MHEMAFIEGILRLVEREGSKAGAEKITAIDIKLGDYSDVVPDILKEYFAIASKGTIAEQAELRLTRVPAVMSCRDCGWEGQVVKRNIRCGSCGSMNMKMLSGREFIVERLEAE